MDLLLAAATDPAAPIAFDWDAFWTMWRVPIRIVAILLVAVLLRVALHFTIRRVVDQVVNGIKRKQNVDDTQALMASPLQAVRVVQRTRTLGSVLNNVVTVVVAGIALVLILGELNFNAVAIVSAAGVVGAGLAFGAQNIVKDMLNGIFMVAEDQLGVGDVVDVGPAAGVVEAVGIRVTQVRDVNGVLWFVRNGEILRVGNMSQGWTRVVIDLAVPYSADVDQVQDAMLNTANELAAIPKWKRAIIDQPEVWGIQSISEEHVVIRIVAKTRSSDRDNVDRELRSRLKKTLDAMDIVLPSLTSVVLTGFDSASSVQGARAPRTVPTPHVPRSKRK
ncbi:MULTISPECIES: mechanosensitive ion channel family protein [unclassified Frigoribacterium]|jgi:small conductance mechanosensitive channel|uniref:mechanosensitive ion channel family protein n=1 Tax=unclassified Frigoribacterium TaxID=2627005 RepID=UPI0006FEE8A2|nr:MULTISPECIES: mechanosensitive ion channel domain-containing protein [unclassified Frigoribacterium]KQN43141.1 mechanosensitive ion channel protein MscS [Frigoribacterium sp. Leaf44]